MKKSDILINPVFSKKLQMVIDNTPPVIAIIGDKGSGKSFLSDYIAKSSIDESTYSKSNMYTFDCSATGIADIRELQSKLKYSIPSTSAKQVQRVIIFEHFDLLGNESQNSLLKTLEEPPLNTLIILTIDDATKVLETIHSRVFAIDFVPVSEAQALEFFSEYQKTDVKKAYAISEGLPGVMSVLLNDINDPAFKYIELSKQIINMPSYQKIGQIDKYTKNKDFDVKQLVVALIRLSQALASNSIRNKNKFEPDIVRLKMCLQCLDDLNSGVGSKLALTNLFLKI